MAVAINVNGTALIKVGTGSAGALESLGYTRDGATIRLQDYFLDVKTDDTGGEAGPGSDTQYMGAMAHISLELTKWDVTISDKLVNRINATTTTLTGTFTSAGTTPTGALGGLMIGSASYVRLLIHSPTRPLNFPVCVIREPIELNSGTKFSTLRIEAQAWSVSGLLFNATTS